MDVGFFLYQVHIYRLVSLVFLFLGGIMYYCAALIFSPTVAGGLLVTFSFFLTSHAVLRKVVMEHDVLHVLSLTYFANSTAGIDAIYIRSQLCAKEYKCRKISI